MDDFDYGKAEADLKDSGCPYPDEIYEYKSEKGRDSFMRENGLNPDHYRKGPRQNNSSGSAGCYITSACVKARGLQDNCYELKVLRSFRDEYLAKLENGPYEIEQYYQIAPAIVSSINKLENAQEIWNSIYETLVSACVEMIKNKQNGEAYLHYKQVCKKLYEQYLHD